MHFNIDLKNRYASAQRMLVLLRSHRRGLLHESQGWHLGQVPWQSLNMSLSGVCAIAGNLLCDCNARDDGG